MTEVTKTEKNEIAVFDYSSVEETGFENQTQEDRSTPYLGVLQQNSPQCRDPEDGGIEGAKAGMFYNSATNELYEGRNDGVVVVPAYTEHVFVEYRPGCERDHIWDQQGDIIVFDDNKLHSAWNDSDHERILFYVDFRHGLS